MKIFGIVLALCLSQGFADPVPDASNHHISSPALHSAVTELTNLIIHTGVMLGDLPVNMSKHAAEVMKENIELVSSLPQDGFLGDASGATVGVLNDLNEIVAEQLEEGAEAIKVEVVALVKNASRLLSAADKVINYDANYAVDLIDNALKKASGSSVQCLHKILGLIRKQTDVKSKVILDCVFDKINKAKEQIHVLINLAETSEEPLDAIVEPLKECIGNTTSESSDEEKLKTATCLITISSSVLRTQATLGSEIFTVLSSTFTEVGNLQTDLPSCATRRFMENIVVMKDIKKAIRACS